MNLVFVSAEVAPYSKAGGLADVAGSLPQALTPYCESVTIVTPLYGQIDTDKHNIHPTALAGEVTLGEDRIPYVIYEKSDDPKGVEVKFVRSDRYFTRDGIYTESNGEGFADNNQRYFFFQLVVLDLISSGDLSPDILHCNDHHTGLLPLLLKDLQSPIRTVFTIHNFLYHGHFSVDEVALLPPIIRSHLTRTQWENYSALLEGIDHSEIVTTVSPGYARELLAGDDIDEHSHGRIQAARAKFSGIVNGIDISYWSPQEDDLLPHRFSSTNLNGKELNKQELLVKSGLDPDLSAPLLGSISRLVENKGFPLIVELLDEFVDMGAKFIFLGSGNPQIADQLRAASKKHPGKIAFDEGFNEPLAHLIEAGSDMFLMPSRFEPCGLNQLYSLRYGTIPIVHQTGGLGDTVENWCPNAGTGFVFSPYSADALRSSMDQALQLFQSKSEWIALMDRAMAKDFSWDQSAKQYFLLYNS